MRDIEDRLRRSVDDRIGDPIWWNDALQLAKTVLAGVAAWVIASSVLDLPQPFLAPWAALLVVHATIYRTFSKAASWPIYGALIINLRNIVDAMGEVAEANPIGGPPLPLRVPQRRPGRRPEGA